LTDGPCDQIAGDTLLFCDDFEDGKLSSSLWEQVFEGVEVNEQGAYTGNRGLQLTTSASIAAKLSEFPAYGYPVRISAWIKPAIAGDYNTYLSLDSRDQDVTLGWFFGSYGHGYQWLFNPEPDQTRVLPEMSKTTAVAQGTWTCVQMLFTDATTVQTSIWVQGKARFDLPTLTAYDFNTTVVHAFNGPPRIGPITYPKLSVDNYMVTLDERGVCPP
jgi:hypothetical protein